MEQNPIYSNHCIEFLTVCAEYCKYIEQCRSVERAEFLRVMCGMLPMIYIKVSVLPQIEQPMGYNEPFVTEEDYNYVRNSVASIMGQYDEYLDVFVADFKFSDEPILCTVSEGLADIYQALRDLTETYRGGHEEAIEAALFDVKESFENDWGQKLLNALKSLHDTRFTRIDE